MVILQKATKEDIDIFYDWQKNPLTRKYFLNNSIPNYTEHCRWMENTLKSKDILMYTINYGNRKVGSIRLNINVNKALVSVLLSPNEYGKGFAFEGLKAVLELHKEFEFEAFIRIENKASQNLFMKCGFIQIEETKYIKKAKSE